MAGEDLKYLSHHGFNFESIKGAIKKNAANGKIQRGGSTISQQTAKNVFLWPSRTWVRKGFEAYFTVLIELFWSKQRIMEVYLNSIEMGDGIYGVDAVAEYHFGKKAIDLTRSECALIVATLPNPRLYNSMIPSAYTRRQQRKIEREMKFIPSFPKEGEAIDPHTAKGTYYK
jgi:monofunctional biosynthetic peptidoglycan transglycosylase